MMRFRPSAGVLLFQIEYYINEYFTLLAIHCSRLTRILCFKITFMYVHTHDEVYKFRCLHIKCNQKEKKLFLDHGPIPEYDVEISVFMFFSKNPLKSSFDFLEGNMLGF